MNLPSISSSDFLPYLDDLTKLIDQGWVPSFGVAGTLWHVSLVHKSAGPLLVALNGFGCSQAWDASPLNVHERNRVLGKAMAAAIQRARAVGSLP